MDHTVETSPFYDAWKQTAQEDLLAIKEAIKERDFSRLGTITEHNGMKMHATTLSANPPFTYWSPDTIRVQEEVRAVRSQTGLSAFMTMDAGPNVKILCRQSQMVQLKKALQEVLPVEFSIIESGVGFAARSLSEREWEDSVKEFEEKGRM
ncbi:Diphosphomevalonate decarboxylase [Streptococcus sp. DD13]|nr:Diphosphomevalonate decarboxylase [Streptococcus sp. DD13]